MAQLRQQMIRAMELKNLSRHTQRSYLAAVSGLARHYRKSPDQITKEMIENYQVPFRTERNGTVYPYVRLYTDVDGTIATGINFSAHLGK